MKIFKLTLILLSIFLLTGCYGKTELDDLAYVIAIGVDKASGDNTKEVLATYQIALPVKLAGENTDTGKDVFTTFTIPAKSLEAANSYLNTLASKEINLSHTKLIVYSEELAKEGLEGHINSFLSNPNVRPKTIISVCKGNAKDFLENISPVLETSPARYYELILSSFNYTGKLAGTEILNFYMNSKALYKTPVAVMSNLTENNVAQFAGLALFKNEKMVGTLDKELVISHLILTDSLKNDIITLDDIYDPKKTLTFSIKQTKKPHVKVKIINDIPSIDIETFLVVHLESNGGNTDYLKQENKDILNKMLNEHITSLLYKYLSITKDLSIDPAGFGRYAKASCFTYKEFENYNWPDIYKNSTFNVKTNIELNVAQIVSHTMPEYNE